jgi:hypothetical protein
MGEARVSFIRLIGMVATSSRLERARQRVADSARRIAQAKLRIASLRAQEDDATIAAAELDELKIEHRKLLEQLALEQLNHRKMNR